ncbi:MAG TPA: 23S rRNA (uracil(1939)-C(5))-methyltransferase, partial [Chromatiales bacterium]|nr:23S rRNA (uracil(1939)-C(5))-methyltransferase [Chromatiales bacterium]
MATQTPLPTDEPIIVEIESLLLDGRGVGHIEGKAVFVAGALPGETVSIGFTRRKRKLDEAVVEEVITPSEQRVEPRCSIFGTCGACSLQHFDADAQIREKQQILLDNLERIGHVTPQDVIEPLTSETWGYRQKARLSVRNVHKKGKVLVGFREKKSRYVAETERCEVLDPRVGQKIPQLAALIASLSIVNDVPQIEVASADDNVALVFRVMSPPTDDDIALLVAFAGEHGYQIYLQRKGPDVLEPIGDAPEFLTYTLPDHDV